MVNAERSDLRGSCGLYVERAEAQLITPCVGLGLLYPGSLHAQNQKNHRQEIRFCKNSQLRQSWKALRHMIHTSAGQAYAAQPPLDEFVDALEKIFWWQQFFP